MSVVTLASESSPSGDDLFDAKAKIRDTHTSELVIALCGPIGSPLHRVASAFKSSLETDFGYAPCRTISLSAIIKRLCSLTDEGSPYVRIKQLIDQGDKLREKHGSSILTEIAISEIILERQKYRTSSSANSYAPRRICHIIDSIKNQEELELLRLVYRDMVYFVGVFSPLPSRIKTLEMEGMTQAQIFDLIDRDSGEELNHGQTVSDTFPNSDCFLRIDTDTDTQINNRVKRFLDLALGTKIITPTSSETAMYFAASAAGNSACLSRQVGAALTDSNGEVVSVGWNDVPRFGGGLYSAEAASAPNPDSDHRCWNLKGGVCFNDEEKTSISELLVSELITNNIVPKEEKARALSLVLKNKKLKNLIEFSRAVHAEMHAIINANRSPHRLKDGGKLYVTAYPCHACARHIVAAGITEVYYIEPYRKSLATKLHRDSITDEESDTSKLRILPYDGVAPARYMKLFRVPPDTRKSGGKMVNVEPKSSQPRFLKTLEALPTLEAIVVRSLREKQLLPEELQNAQ